MSHDPMPTNRVPNSSSPTLQGASPERALVNLVGVSSALNTSFTERPREQPHTITQPPPRALEPLTAAERMRDPKIARWDTVAHPLKDTAVATLAGVLLIGVGPGAATGSAILMMPQPFSFAHAVSTGALMAFAGFAVASAIYSMRSSLQSLRSAWRVRREDQGVSATKGIEDIKEHFRRSARDRVPAYGGILHRYNAGLTNVVKVLTALYDVATEQQTVRDRLLLLAVAQRVLTVNHRRCAVTKKINRAFVQSVEELAADKTHPLDLPLQMACIEGTMLAAYGDRVARDRLAAGLLQVAGRLSVEFSLPIVLMAHAAATKTSLERRSAEEMLIGKLGDVASAEQRYSWLTRAATMRGLEADQHRVIAAELQKVLPELPAEEQEVARLIIDRLLKGGVAVNLRLLQALDRQQKRLAKEMASMKSPGGEAGKSSLIGIAGSTVPLRD